MSSKKSKKRMGSTRRHQGFKAEEREGNAELQESSSAEHLQPFGMPTCQLDSVLENVERDQHDAGETRPEKLETGKLAEICEAETSASGKKRRMGSTRRAKQERQAEETKEEKVESMQIIQEELNISAPEDQYLKEHSNTLEVVLDEAQTQMLEEGWSKVKGQVEMTEDESPNEQHKLLSDLGHKTDTAACSAESSPAVNLTVSVTGIHPNEEEALHKQDEQTCITMFEAKEISNETPLEDTNQSLDQQMDGRAEVSTREEQWGAKDVNLESNIEMEGITVEGDNKQGVLLRTENQEKMQIEKVNEWSVKETEVESGNVQDFSFQMQDVTQMRAFPSTEKDTENSQVETQEIRVTTLQDLKLTEDDMQFREMPGFTDKLEMAFTISVSGEDLERADDVIEDQKKEQKDLIPDENTEKNTEACPSAEILTDGSRTSTRNSPLVMEGDLDYHYNKTDRVEDTSQEASAMLEIHNPGLLEEHISEHISFHTQAGEMQVVDQRELTENAHFIPTITPQDVNQLHGDDSYEKEDPESPGHQEGQSSSNMEVLGQAEVRNKLSPLGDSGQDYVETTIVDTETMVSFSHQIGFETLSEASNSFEQQHPSSSHTPHDSPNIGVAPLFAEQGTGVSNIFTVVPDFSHSIHVESTDTSETSTFPDYYEFSFKLQHHEEEDGVKQLQHYEEEDGVEQSASREKRRMGSTRRTKREHKMEKTCGVMSIEEDNANKNMDVKTASDLTAEKEGAIIDASQEKEFVTSQTEVETLVATLTSIQQDQDVDSTSAEMMPSSFPISNEDDERTQENQHSEATAEQLEDDYLKGCNEIFGKETAETITTVGTELFNEASISDIGDQLQGHENNISEESSESLGHQNMEDIKMEASEQAKFGTELSSPTEDSTVDFTATTVEDMDTTEETKSFSCQIGVETLTCVESLTSSSPDQITEIDIVTQNMNTENVNIEMFSPDVQHSEEAEPRTQVPILSSTVELEVSVTADVSDFSHLPDHEEEGSVKQGASRQKRRMGSTRRTKRENKTEETSEATSTKGDDVTEDMNMDSDLRAEAEGDVTKADIILTSRETEIVTRETDAENVVMTLSFDEQDQFTDFSISSEMVSSFPQYNPQEDEPNQENQHKCPDVDTEQLDDNELKDNETSIPRQETAEASTAVGADISYEEPISDDGDQLKKHEDEKMEKSVESPGHQNTEEINMNVSEQAVQKLSSSSREDVSPDCSVTTVENVDMTENTQYFSCLGSSTFLDPFPETAITQQNVSIEVSTPDFQHSEEAEQGTQFRILSSTMESESEAPSVTMDVSDFSYSLAVDSTVRSETDTVSDHSDFSLKLQHHEEEEGVKQGTSRQKKRMGSTRRTKREHKMEETFEVLKETIPEQTEGENKLSPTEDPSPDCVVTTIEDMDTTEKTESFTFQIDVEGLTSLGSPLSHSSDHVPEIAVTPKNFNVESSDQDESSFELQRQEGEETTEVVTSKTDIEMNSPDVKPCGEEEQWLQSHILSSTLEVSSICTAVPDFSHSIHVESTETTETSAFPDHNESPLKVQHHEEEGSVKEGASRQKRRMGSTRRTKRENKTEETSEAISTEGDDVTEDLDMDSDLRAEAEGDVTKADIILTSRETEIVTRETDAENVVMTLSFDEQDQFTDFSISSEIVSSFPQYNPQEDEPNQENQHKCPDVDTEQLDDNELKDNETSIPRQETAEAITAVGADISNEESISDDGDQLKKHEDEKMEKSVESPGHQNIEEINMNVSEQAIQKLSSSSREDISPDCSVTTVENMDMAENTESFSCQRSVETLTCFGSSTSLDPFPETAVTQQNVSLEVSTLDIQQGEEAEQGTQFHILSSTMESESEAPSIIMDASDFSYSLAVDSTVRSETDTVSDHPESSFKLQHHEEEEGVKQGTSRQKKRMGSTRRTKRDNKMEETFEVLKETIPEQTEGENKLSPTEDPSSDCVATTVEDMDTTEKTESFTFQLDVESLTSLGSPLSHSSDHVPEIAVTPKNFNVESSDQDESSFKLQRHKGEEITEVVTSKTDIEMNSPDVEQCGEEEQWVQSHILSSTLEASNVCTVVPDLSHSVHVESTETSTFPDCYESSLNLKHHEEEGSVTLGGSKQKRRMGSTRRTKREHKMEETREVVIAEDDATEDRNMKTDADLRAENEGDIIDVSKGKEFVITHHRDDDTLPITSAPVEQGQDVNSSTSTGEKTLTAIVTVGTEICNETSVDDNVDQVNIQEQQKSEKTLEPLDDLDKGNIISKELSEQEDESKASSTREGPILDTTVENMDTSETPSESHTFNTESSNVAESGGFSEQWESSFRLQHHEKEEDSKQDLSKQKRKMGSTRRRKRESDEIHLDETQSSSATEVTPLIVTEADIEMRDEENLQSEKISFSEKVQAVCINTTPIEEEFKDYQTGASEVTVDELNKEDMSRQEKSFLSMEETPDGTISLEAADVESYTKSQPDSCSPIDNQININPDPDSTYCPESSETKQIEDEVHLDQFSTTSEPEHVEEEPKATPRRKIGSTRRVNRRQEDKRNESKDEETEEMQNQGNNNILMTQEVEVVEAQREEDVDPPVTQREVQNDTIAEEREMIEGQIQNTVPEMSVTVCQYQETEGSPGMARRRKLGSTRRSRKEQTERKYVVMDGMLMYTDTETNSAHDSEPVHEELKDKEERGIHEPEDNTEVIACNTVVSLPDSLQTIQETRNNEEDELSEKEQCILASTITAELPPLVDMAGNDNCSVHGDTLAVNSGTPPLETSDSSEESKPRKKRMGSSRKISQRQHKDKTESYGEVDVRNDDSDALTNTDKHPVKQDTGGPDEAEHKAEVEGLLNDESRDTHESEYSKPASEAQSHPDSPSVTELHDQSHLGQIEISESSAAGMSFSSTLCADDSPNEPRSMLQKRKMGSSRRGQGLGNRMKGAANVEEDVDDINTPRQETRDETAPQSTEDFSVEGEQLLLAFQSSNSDEPPMTQGERPNGLIEETATTEPAKSRTSFLSASLPASSDPQEDISSIDPQSTVKKRKMGSTRRNNRRHGEDINSDQKREQGLSTERYSDDSATGDMEVHPVPAETIVTQKASETVQPEDTVTQDVNTGHGSADHKQDSGGSKRKMGSRRGGQGYRGIGAMGAPEDQPVSQGQDSDSSLLQGSQENTHSEDVPEQGPSKQGSQSQKETQKLEQPPAGARSKSDLERKDGQRETLTSLGEAIMFNIVMVGDSSVGKTSFIRRLERGEFLPDPSATLGVDTSILPLVVDGKLVKLQIWDTAGQERFHSITRQVLHKAQGLILMYDVSSCQSFSAVRKWIACIEEGAPTEVIILLLGNKNDSEDRQVLHPEGKRLAEEYNIHFMECSAVTGHNVSQAMETLARLLKQTVKENDQQYVSLHKKPQQKKSGCC